MNGNMGATRIHGALVCVHHCAVRLFGNGEHIKLLSRAEMLVGKKENRLFLRRLSMRRLSLELLFKCLLPVSTQVRLPDNLPAPCGPFAGAEVEHVQPVPGHPSSRKAGWGVKNEHSFFPERAALAWRSPLQPPSRVPSCLNQLLFT